MKILTAAIIGVFAIATASANTLIEITSQGTPTQTHSHSSGLYPPGHAIDGDLSTFNHTESTSPGAAWQLRLPDETSLARIEIVSRDCCPGRLNGATLRLFDSEAEMVFEADIIDGGPLTTFTAEIPSGMKAREIRIGFNPGESGIVHLAEVRVFAPAGEPPLVNQFNATGSTLSWDVSRADTIEIYANGSVSASGALPVTPSRSQAYFLIATNECESIIASTPVIIDGVPLQPRITEFSAALEEDWVEIWNPGNTAIDLTGWHLTDKREDLERWSFPVGQILEPGDFLVVTEPFGIAREANSYLALINPAGASVSKFTYPEQREGISFGSDFNGDSVFFRTPTPGDYNSRETSLGFLEGVEFSIPRQVYHNPISLSLTPKTPGAIVLYSLGGAEPTTEYTGPIEITTTTVVRAIETRSGFEASRSEAHTYLYWNDISSQQEFPAGLPDDWLPSSANGALAPIPRRSDYEMDPEIVATSDIPTALRSIPSMCLTLPPGQMWDPEDGLHANALKRGRSWEREISMEILDPTGASFIHTKCGLRIHGGRGRVAEMLKKSFRLYFRGDYGAKKFEFPLFEDMPVGGVDHLVLRGGNGKTWASPWRDLTGGGNSLPRATYLRDQFLRDTQRAMGQPGYAGTFVHLYLNGIYWGLYNPVERPGGNYAANHFGGDEEDYDFVKWANGLSPQILNGDLEAWNQLVALTRSNPAANWEAIQDLLDVDNLADYLIANFYVGNIDWVGNNAYAFRSRTAADGRFRFTCWDGEESLLTVNRDSTGGGNNTDRPMELHNNLRAAVPEYRLRFADRIHRHLIDEDGALLTDAATARHKDLVALIDLPIAAESARWGDLLRPDNPYTRDRDWLAEIANITNNYLTRRPGISFTQMKTDNLYPDTGAPVAGLVGGNQVQLTSTSGEIWFTIDGTDPISSATAERYDPAVGRTPIVVNASWRYLDDGSDLATIGWNAPGFDDSAWPEGRAPLGYGSISGRPLNTTISFGDSPFDRPVTNYFRHQFELAELDQLGTTTLEYFRDDGIAIYLNGIEVERSNLPGGPLTGTTLASKPITGTPEGILHTAYLPPGLLQVGENLLAVELHQDAINSSDTGFDLSLQTTRVGIPLSGDTRIKARTLVAEEWSALEEETFRIVDPLGSLVISEVMYHPGPPTESEISAGFENDRDFEYLEIRNVGERGILLDGIRFTKGIDMTLSGFIEPGDVVLVVANRTAFEFRYGAGLPVIGEWEPGDQLGNSGERIRLLGADDIEIFDFQYSDGSGWPDSADGKGHSLVMIAPKALLDPALPINWRPSATINGNPGSSDTMVFSGGGSAELMDHAVGQIFPIELLPSFKVRLSIDINPFADDTIGTLEISSDMQTWESAESLFNRSQLGPISDGYSRVTYTTIGGRPQNHWFLRYRVKLRD